jgi:hypothetical protein
VVTLAKFADDDAAAVRAFCAHLHFLILQAKSPTPPAAAVVALQRRASAPPALAAAATTAAASGGGYNRWQ